MLKIVFYIKPRLAACLLTAVSFVLLLGGCSGGNGGGTAPITEAKVTGGILKLGTSGTSAIIAGIDIRINLPAGVSVAADPVSGETASGAVTISGAAATGNNNLVSAKYVAATNAAPAQLHIVLINAGGFHGGEFASVRFGLASGVSLPTKDAFSVASFSANGLDGSPLSGVTAAPLSVDATAAKQAPLIVSGTLPFYLDMHVDTPTQYDHQTIFGTLDLPGVTPTIIVSPNDPVNPISKVGPVTINNGTWSADIRGLVEGENIVTVTATDPNSLEIASVSATIIVDTVKPNLNVDHALYGTKNYFTVIGGTVDDPPYHIVSLDVNCPSATVDLVSVAVPNWSAMISNLSYGDNTCHVTATDAAGNHSSKDVIIHYDNLAPDLVIHFDDYLKYGTSLNLYGTVESGITPVVTVNGSPYTGAVTVNGPNWSCPVSGLTEGANTITVTATDSYGNVSTRTAIVYAVVAYGNFSGSQQPTIADALKALRYAIGVDVPVQLDLLYGDLYADGKIDLADAILILEKVVY